MKNHRLVAEESWNKVIELQFLIINLPAKKQPSSPKRGLKVAHLGAEYSAINVQRLTNAGNP